MPSNTQDTSSVLQQALYGTVIVSTAVNIGFNTAWPVVLPIDNNNTVTELSLTQTDMQWLVSVRPVSGCFAQLLVGVLMEAMGPTRHLFLCFLPTVGLWLLMALFPSKPMLYAGRALLGVTISMIHTIIISLSTEVLSPDLRGVFGAMQRMVASMGSLIVYVMAFFLDWRMSTALFGVLTIPFGFLLLFVPESPYWLVKHGRSKEAFQSLAALRGPKSDVAKEFQDINRGFLEQPSVSIRDQLVHLKFPWNHRPVILATVTVILMVMCGEHAITQYTVYLFNEANLNIDSYICSILVGIVYLSSTFVATFIIVRVGRRHLLMGTCALCSTTLILTAFYLIYDIKPRWVALIFVLVYVVGLGSGTGPLFNIMIGELLPTPVRSIGISICSMMSLASMFVGSYCFPLMVSDFGIEITCCVYAGFNLVMAFVAWVWIPETQGKTLVDLQNSFTPKNWSNEKTKQNRESPTVDHEEKKAVQPVTNKAPK